MSCVPDQFMIDRGDGVLPQLRLRNPWAEVARDGTHVAVQQLVPRLGERVCELVRILVEALRDRRIDRIHLQRKVRREHHGGVPLRRIVSIRHGSLGLGIRGSVLLRTGGARRQLPVVLMEVVEIPVVPLRRVSGPCALEAAGDRVGPFPLPNVFLQPKPCSSRLVPSGSGPTCSGAGAAPWALPTVCPPTMSATVSSSFIAMRANVCRMYFAARAGSGLPPGPSGFT